MGAGKPAPERVFSIMKNAYKIARLAKKLSAHWDAVQSEIELDVAFRNWLGGLDDLQDLIDGLDDAADDILGANNNAENARLRKAGEALAEMAKGLREGGSTDDEELSKLVANWREACDE